MTDAPSRVGEIFAGRDPIVGSVYDRLVHELSAVGPFSEEPRESSVYLAHSVTFAGVHPGQSHLILSLRLDRPVDGARAHRTEQVSANRWQVEFKLTDPAEVDELRDLLVSAMALV